jgi:hypothetical protein
MHCVLVLINSCHVHEKACSRTHVYVLSMHMRRGTGEDRLSHMHACTHTNTTHTHKEFFMTG